MNNNNDRDAVEKHDSGIRQEPQKKNNTEPRTFTEPDNPSRTHNAVDKEEVAKEKQPTRQMTGGPDKPTA